MFTTDADFDRPDWPLVEWGAVTLFWNPAVLVEVEGQLKTIGYKIDRVSCREGVEAFRDQMSDALNWKGQFGYWPWTGNLDALEDGFRDYPGGPEGRAALVLDGFHMQAQADENYAHAILDIIEGASRDLLLRSRILIGLVQTDDNQYACPPIGGRRAHWNRRELANQNRGL